MPPHQAIFIKTLKPGFGRRRHIFAANQVDVRLCHQAGFIINAFFGFLQQDVRLYPTTLAEYPLAIHIIYTTIFISHPVQSTGHLADSKVKLFDIGHFSTDAKRQFHVMQVLLAISIRIPQIRVFYQQGRKVFRRQFHNFCLTGTQSYFLRQLNWFEVSLHILGISGKFDLVDQCNPSIHLSFDRFCGSILHFKFNVDLGKFSIDLHRHSVGLRQGGGDKRILNQHFVRGFYRHFLVDTHIPVANHRSAIPSTGYFQSFVFKDVVGMSAYRTEYFQLGAGSRNTRMIHLIYFYCNAIVGSGTGILGYVEFKATEHAHNVFLIGNLTAIYPNICPVVDAVQSQPYLLAFI